jgi:hypothetical protein
MSNRKHSPEHDFWHRRVEGQIRHTIGQHPEWFNFPQPYDKKHCVNSLSKRIVGEILAVRMMAKVTKDMTLHCDSSAAHRNVLSVCKETKD